MRCNPRVWDNWVMKCCFISLIGEACWTILRQYLSTQWPSLSARDMRLSHTVTINITQSSTFLMPPSLTCTDISQEPAALIVVYPTDGRHRLLKSSLPTYQTARRHIPEDHTLHIHIPFQMLANSKLPCFSCANSSTSLSISCAIFFTETG